MDIIFRMTTMKMKIKAKFTLRGSEVDAVAIQSEDCVLQDLRN